uniref:Uncharacterized protein n=1 Tax=Onchocerca volvulus TaxID=6282 RepID=A0A8R1TWY3_ONCVO
KNFGFKYAFEWIVNNIQSIYKNPAEANKKLRIALGNRSIPINIAIKSLQIFVKNHTISKSDMKKYCSFEGRNKITLNEL